MPTGLNSIGFPTIGSTRRTTGQDNHMKMKKNRSRLRKVLPFRPGRVIFRNMNPKNMSLIILAGGLGSRMGGVRKAFLEVGGRRIIERLLDELCPAFGETVVSCRAPEDFANYPVRTAPDRFEARSSLTGIHAGLSVCAFEHAFVCACDAPFVQQGLAVRLAEQGEETDDVVIPLKEDGYREPLCAVYSRRCVRPVAEQLDRGEYKIIGFFGQVQVREVPVSLLRPGDPDLLSFVNVNTPEELERWRAAAEAL